MKYAVGEIVLIVIGILIALQINDWNEQRKESKIEKQLINVLITDLKSKKAEFSSDLADVKSIIKKSGPAIKHWKSTSVIDTLNLKYLLEVLSQDGWFFNINSPVYASISGSGLWKQLPDSLTLQIDNVYRMRFSPIKVAFEKQVEYATDAKSNFLAPNHLLDLDEDLIEIQKIVQDNDEEFISHIELFKSGVLRLSFNFEMTIRQIDMLVENLETYKNYEK